MSILASEFQSLILRIKELEEIVAELKRNNEGKAGVKLSISSFYDRFTPKMVGLISFRGACSIRLSFKYSNPVVF